MAADAGQPRSMKRHPFALGTTPPLPQTQPERAVERSITRRTRRVCIAFCASYHFRLPRALYRREVEPPGRVR